MSQSTLPTRNGDPDTSFEAAAKAAEKAPIIRDVVLNLVTELGPLTHDDLIRAYRRKLVLEPETPPASDSGIRTRLSELRRAGFIIEDPEKGKSAFGNNAKRWVIAPQENA